MKGFKRNHDLIRRYFFGGFDFSHSSMGISCEVRVTLCLKDYRKGAYIHREGGGGGVRILNGIDQPEAATILVGRSETTSYLKYLPDQLMVSINVP